MAKIIKEALTVQKLQWYVKQLFPLTYFAVVDRSARGNQGGRTIFCI